MDQAFKLRYQVYCMETGFEDRAAFADRRERDAFDTHAAHGVIRDRISGTSLATVRLVMPDSQHGCSQFPIEQQYPTLLDENGIDDSVLPRASTGEISRFAISKRSRQQITELAGQELATRTLSPRFTCPKRRRLYGRRSPLVTFRLVPGAGAPECGQRHHSLGRDHGAVAAAPAGPVSVSISRRSAVWWNITACASPATGRSKRCWTVFRQRSLIYGI